MTLLQLLLTVALLPLLILSGAVRAAFVAMLPAPKGHPTALEPASNRQSSGYEGATNRQRTGNERASNSNANGGRSRTMGDSP